jgi:hypothetical protein
VQGFRVSSRLHAAPAAVWACVATLDGVNDELAPFIRMTRPPRAEAGELRAGFLGRSWLLLGGVVPIDFDDIHLVAVEPGRWFRERSVLGSAPVWSHDRRLLPLPAGGCRVVDDIAFEPRVRALRGLQAFILEAAFRWRHRRLRRRFGVVDRSDR